jgi:DNA-binding GntR family transcriptional regulator
VQSENVNETLISAQRAAHEQLRAMILIGSLRSGQKLRQEEIAKRLGLSRLPVREALNRLEIEGLVEQKPRRGFYVTSLDIDEVEDIFEMRAMLEAHAGSLATQRRTPKDADDVDLAFKALERVVKKGRTKQFDYAVFAEANARFHNRIYVTSGRKYLLRQIVMLRNSVGPLIQIIASDKDEMSFAQEEHRQLAHFYRQGNAAGVAEICREHCARTGRALVHRIAAHRGKA